MAREKSFVDSSIFIVALIDAGRELTETEKEAKKEAKEAIRLLARGEFLYTSIVHMAELFMLLESLMHEKAFGIFLSLLMNKNLVILDCRKDELLLALLDSAEKGSCLMSSLAKIIAEKHGIKSFFSLDSELQR